MTSRILIADDDRDLAGLLADYLRHESYAVEMWKTATTNRLS